VKHEPKTKSERTSKGGLGIHESMKNKHGDSCCAGVPPANAEHFVDVAEGGKREEVCGYKDIPGRRA
jgi:hypothetical protein